MSDLLDPFGEVEPIDDVWRRPTDPTSLAALDSMCHPRFFVDKYPRPDDDDDDSVILCRSDKRYAPLGLCLGIYDLSPSAITFSVYDESANEGMLRKKNVPPSQDPADGLNSSLGPVTWFRLRVENLPNKQHGYLVVHGPSSMPLVKKCTFRSEAPRTRTPLHGKLKLAHP